ncbi:vitamin B12 transporter [Desulfoluna spongiiphila]|uniref:Vitamin B12 transporter n=2 Tax=Desulfoluna spongiiphila TaxID=419481 RepID=A0A1G5FEU7_9BACT|nr:vitamin B12 transporter [Desulfoluna spongiiphila]
MRKSLMIGAVAAWVAGTSPAWATDTALDEYVVTASRAKESITEVAAAVTVIDAEVIENSSAKDLGELLSEKGGVQVLQYPGALSGITIRGFSTESHGNDLMGHVLILIDGRRAGTGNAAKILTKNIERVEIIKGPAAVQYGSAAMGGVVNVITKKGDAKPTVYVEAKGGSAHYREFASGASGQVGKFDFSAAVSHSEEGDYETGNGTKYNNTGNDGILHASINTGFEFLPGNRIGLIYTAFDADKVGNPGYITENDPDNYKDSENSSYDLTYDGVNASESLAWKARWFGGNDKDSWIDPDPTSGYVSSQETDSKGAQAQISWAGETFGLTTGVDWVDYDIDATWDPKKTNFSNTAGFALAKAKLLDNKMIITGGARYDHYEVEVSGGQGRDESDDDMNPSLGVVYNVSKNIKIRANVAEAFRMPSAKELAYDHTTPGSTWSGVFYPGTHYVGNPDLDPEKSRTYEVGMDVNAGGMRSALTLFTTDFEDKIVSAVNDDGDSTWENLGEATISGVEGDVSYTIGDLFGAWELRPYAAVTYLYEFKDDETDKDLQKVADTTVSGGISLTDLDGFFADLSVSYLSSQKVTDHQFKTKEEVTLASVTVSNLTITKRVISTDTFGTLSLRGEVKNIFDEDAAYIQGYPIPGRQFFAGVTWSY